MGQRSRHSKRNLMVIWTEAYLTKMENLLLENAASL